MTVKKLTVKIPSFAANWIVRVEHSNAPGHNCVYRINAKSKSKRIFARKFTKRTAFSKMLDQISRMQIIHPMRYHRSSKPHPIIEHHFRIQPNTRMPHIFTISTKYLAPKFNCICLRLDFMFFCHSFFLDSYCLFVSWEKRYIILDPLRF